MDKQRLAEIMLELQQGAKDFADMDISVMLMVLERGQATTIGVSRPVDMAFMVASMIRRLAEESESDTDDVIDGIRLILSLADKLGLQSNDI